MERERVVTQACSPPPTSPRPDGVDLTGRDRLARNVLASWGGQMVFIVFGFILPRLIDNSLGRSALGVWDFSWSIVMYFTLVQAGIVASVNRYVARFRARDDTAGINRAVSSVTAVLTLMALVMLGLSVAAFMLIPTWFADRLGADAHHAGWLILLLGTSLAVQTALSAFGGVLTGHHRWDLHNALLAGGYLVQATGMIVVLLLGFSLPILGLMVLLGEMSSRTASLVVAHRICPSLCVRPYLATRAQAREMFIFGVQGCLPNIGDLVLYSTVSALIVGYLGPAALALYARPMALIRHTRTLVHKFAFVLVPTASSLQALERQADIQRFLVDATRCGAYIALPLITLLTLLGGPLLHLWMGPDYAHDAIIITLAVGHLLILIQRPTFSVLVGLNHHGPAGLALLIAALAAIAGAAFALIWLNAGLVGAALGVVIPLSLINGIYLPVYTCRRVQMPLVRYLRESLLGPLACTLPFAACLAAARLLFADRPHIALACGLVIGGLVGGITYWRYVLPASLTASITTRFRRQHPQPAENVTS